MIRTRLAAALACLMLVVSARAISADVRADGKSLVKFEGMLGRMVNLFGGKGARDGIKSTVAVKGNRKITLNDNTGQIVDLDEEKIYDLDLKKKAYRVTTFAELRRQLEEARRKAEEEARKAEAEARKESNEPAEPPPASERQVEVDFNVKETGEKKAINGFDTRQVVMTIAMREKGKTLEESGGLVLTADSWIAPKIAAMNEVAEFDIRYAKAIAGPMIAGASAQDMAAAMAMYPMMKDALDRMRAENVRLEGTPILTTVTVDAVKSAEQMAQTAKQEESSSRPSLSGGVGGLVGGLGRRAARRGRDDAPKSRATFMTTTHEVLKVATDVAATETSIPAGFKENK